MNSDDMRRGVIPGFIAGYLFLAYAGPQITINFAAHFIISIVIGALYTGVFMLYVDLGNPLVNIIIGGAIYGLIWWIVGWNIIMPFVSGGEVLQLDTNANFYGHIIFGHSLAFLVVLRDAAMGMGSDSYYKYFPKQKHPGGYVYKVQNPKSGLTKIGRTVDPKRRMQELQREHGKQLRFSSVAKSDDAPKDEHRLHKRLTSKRKDGEWFDLN